MEGRPIDSSFGRNICHAIVLGDCSLLDPERSGDVAGRAFHVSKGKATTIGQVARDIGLLLLLLRMKKPFKVSPLLRSQQCPWEAGLAMPWLMNLSRILHLGSPPCNSQFCTND